MKKFGNEIWFLLMIFFLVNVVQSLFTSISKDEAYYWMFARQPDWGYFDHPPMVALFIKAGTILFNGTLGVRLLTVVASVLILFMTWKLVPEEDRKKKHAVPIFFLVSFSMPVFNIYGFITTPDVPLLLFSAIYLYVFRQFIGHQNAINALKLGIVAALLMYSKYHGAFLILFSLIPHYRLLLNRFFYLAGITGIVLYLPHVYWQYQHEFISFRYHLFQRADGFMGGKHILNFILNAFVILNPFFFGFYLYSLKSKTGTYNIPRVFTYVLWGFLLFFAFNSVRDHIEPQWIGVAAIPLTVILVSYILNTGNMLLYARRLAVISIILILVLRIALVLPVSADTEFHSQKASYYGYIREKARGSKVVFINSYADASKYTFYTGEPAFSYNCYDYRKNQFDLWDFETDYHRQTVFFLTGYAYPWTDSSITVENDLLYYKHIGNFPMINKTTGRILEIEETAIGLKIHSITFTVRNPYGYPLVFNDTANPMRFYLVCQIGRKRFLTRLGTGELNSLEAGGEMEVRGFYFPIIPAGEYEVAVGLQPGLMSPVLITEKKRVTVK